MSVRARIASAVAVGLLAAACPASEPTHRVLVRATPGADIDLAKLRWRGPVRGASAPDARGIALAVARTGERTRVRLWHPRACPEEVTVTPADVDVREVELAPRLVVVDQLQVGFSAPFELRAEHRCPKATGAAPFRWTQVGGPPLAGLQMSEDGAVLRGRTHSLAELHPDPLPWGIAPLSPARRGAYSFEVVAADGARATARVTAAARTSGVPSVGVGHRLLLGGSGWRIAERPDGSGAELEAGAGATVLVPDRQGRWLLRDGDDRRLMIRVGRYDEVPLDCGRGECHPRETSQVRTSPMTTIFARMLSGEIGEADSPACARDCHAVGERGVDDGGFAELQHALSVALPARGAPGVWESLPRELRRLGGVGCTGCHGPAAIPLPGAAVTALRSDMCAVCHDAPPRYGHVAAWRQNRMARADADERTRAKRCARCHTTSGFLAWQGEVAERVASTPRPDVIDVDYPYVATGVACAACHDPHDGAAGAGLLRAIDPPALVPAVEPWRQRAVALCLACHAPDPFPATPAATASAIVLGRGGVAVRTGAPMIGAAPHGKVAGGCLGCHNGGPGGELERGGSHSFRADPKQCGDDSCHAGTAWRVGDGDAAQLTARARALLAELARRRGVPATPADDVPHATGMELAGAGELERAYYDVALVAEDPAAVYHNRVYARELLDEVEGWLAGR